MHNAKALSKVKGAGYTSGVRGGRKIVFSCDVVT